VCGSRDGEIYNRPSRWRTWTVCSTVSRLRRTSGVLVILKLDAGWVSKRPRSERNGPRSGPRRPADLYAATPGGGSGVGLLTGAADEVYPDVLRPDRLSLPGEKAITAARPRPTQGLAGAAWCSGRPRRRLGVPHLAEVSASWPWMPAFSAERSSSIRDRTRVAARLAADILLIVWAPQGNRRDLKVLRARPSGPSPPRRSSPPHSTGYIKSASIIIDRGLGVARG
jgi:hypothetical protein